MPPKWKHRELKQQSEKKTEEPPKEPEKQPLTPVRVLRLLGLPAALLALAALTSRASQASLAPIYGAIPSGVNHGEAVTATVLLGCVWRYYFSGLDARQYVLPYLALWAFWIPGIQNYLLKYSGQLGPVVGAIVLGFVSCHTVIIPSAYVAAEVLEALELQETFGPVIGAGLPAVAMDLLYFRPLEVLFARILPLAHTYSGVFSPVKLQLLIAAAYALISPVKPYWLLSLAAPGVLYSFLANPHMDAPITTNTLNNALQPLDWKLLDRQWSNTGYLSVLESSEAQYRVLRCDHSLLGGEWLLTDQRRKEGWKVNEPIYNVFEMLEAVRLVEQEPAVSDSEAKALVVGLGIGTAPKALIAHGINTTIVELDPVVHQFATKYFDLPREHAAVLQDAVSWVDREVAKGGQRYDYIIHDVFTGGAEPLPFFTEAFLSNLRSLLKPSGVIAVNYAGDLGMDLTARTLNTIDQAFDRQCKIYRDQPSAPTGGDAASPSSEAAKEDFLNMVIFCRSTPGEITFRKPNTADLLGSKSREHYLLPKPELEINFPLRKDESRRDEVLRKGEEGQWAGQQAESAIRHWHIMRRVVPDAVWELW